MHYINNETRYSPIWAVAELQQYGFTSWLTRLKRSRISNKSNIWIGKIFKSLQMFYRQTFQATSYTCHNVYLNLSETLAFLKIFWSREYIQIMTFTFTESNEYWILMFNAHLNLTIFHLCLCPMLEHMHILLLEIAL